MSNDQNQNQNHGQTADQIRETFAAMGVTFGGSIVLGDQVGHSGGTVNGTVYMNNQPTNQQ